MCVCKKIFCKDCLPSKTRSKVCKIELEKEVANRKKMTPADIQLLTETGHNPNAFYPVGNGIFLGETSIWLK